MLWIMSRKKGHFDDQETVSADDKLHCTYQLMSKTDTIVAFQCEV